MTEFACGSFTRCDPAPCGSRVGAYHNTSQRALPAQCRTPVNEPPRANSGFRQSTVVRHGSAYREMVHMLGEQSASVSDRIQGEWETRVIYLAGGRLSSGESLAGARHSAHGFGCGDGGSGVAHLALALLLRAIDRASAVALSRQGWLYRPRTCCRMMATPLAARRFHDPGARSLGRRESFSTLEVLNASP